MCYTISTDRALTVQSLYQCDVNVVLYAATLADLHVLLSLERPSQFSSIKDQSFEDSFSRKRFVL